MCPATIFISFHQRIILAMLPANLPILSCCHLTYTVYHPGWRGAYIYMQAQDNVLFSGKIQEYEAAFELVDKEKKGEVPACCTVEVQVMQV